MCPLTRIDDLDVSLGKRTRLHRILHEFGPGKGKAMLLPIDHGLEHGPKDFFANPEAGDPEYQLKLAARGGYSGIVFHVGIAEKYMRKYVGRIPLILKVNGKTNIPPDDEALSAMDASGLFSTTQATIMATIAPAAADRFVVTAM